MTVEDRARNFKHKSTIKHGGFYDYSKTVYENSKEKVCITCPTHGDFWQRPDHHLSGQGCNECRKYRLSLDKKSEYTRLRPDLSHITTPHGSKAVPVGTDGTYALVDEEDYDRVMQYNWRLTNGYAKSYGVADMHRLIMNPPDGMAVDHVSHNKLDNRKSQLRVCSSSENARNKKPLSGTSEYKGVGLLKHGKWQSQIKVNYKNIHLGNFDTEIEAAKAYDEAAKKYHGEFAYLNFP